MYCNGVLYSLQTATCIDMLVAQAKTDASCSRTRSAFKRRTNEILPTCLVSVMDHELRINYQDPKQIICLVAPLEYMTVF